MSYYCIPFLCKHYEDYERYGPAGHYLKHWPTMWPEEAHAECALYEEQKTMRKRFPTFMFDNVQWCRHHCDSRTWARRVPFALASLVRECGWTVRNQEDVEQYHVRPIYETDKRRKRDVEEDDETNQPTDNGIEIDHELLARIMGDILPVYTIRKYRVIVRPPMNREGIQAYALATLAADNGWQCGQSVRANNYKRFYQVR